MNYWLMKSEPNAFSIDDLINSPKQTTHWDGVRNYQARNILRDQMKKGDRAFFYHSNCKPAGIVGLVEIVKEGYPDFTAFDPEEKYYDPKSDPTNPRWYMVDVKFQKKFDIIISLAELRREPQLTQMQLLKKGNRLSVMPVTPEEWQIINEMNVEGVL